MESFFAPYSDITIGKRDGFLKRKRAKKKSPVDKSLAGIVGRGIRI
jgi:hypothetical protein